MIMCIGIHVIVDVTVSTTRHDRNIKGYGIFQFDANEVSTQRPKIKQLQCQAHRLIQQIACICIWYIIWYSIVIGQLACNIFSFCVGWDDNVPQPPKSLCVL